MDKSRGRPTLRLVAKYFMLQLPGVVAFALVLLLVRHWIEFPDDLVWVLLGIWLGKDIFLFPILWRFYDPSQHPDRFRMIDRKGVAVTDLNPDGYVLVQGERWQAAIAEGEASVREGAAVCVTGIDGLKLMVRPYVKE